MVLPSFIVIVLPSCIAINTRVALRKIQSIFIFVAMLFLDTLCNIYALICCIPWTSSSDLFEFIVTTGKFIFVLQYFKTGVHTVSRNTRNTEALDRQDVRFYLHVKYHYHNFSRILLFASWKNWIFWEYFWE